MLKFLSRRYDTQRMIWEYLDGEITTSRAELLTKRLANKAQARQRFIESAVMHGMLFSYFKDQARNEFDLAETGQDQYAPRKSRKSPAA